MYHISHRVVSRVAMSVALVGSMSGVLAQVAGTQPLGMSIEETQRILEGWSVKRAILNKPVYNDNNEKIGTVRDVIIAPDRSVSFAILSVGGFVGVGAHDVAIPIEKIDVREGNFYLAGATKDALKAAPDFEYSKLPKIPKPRKQSSNG